MNAQKQTILSELRNRPVLIARRLGFDRLDQIHNEWIKEMIYGEGDMTLLAHRGSYKTTCLSVAILMCILLYPEENIIFFRKTDTDVVEVVKQVIKMMETRLFFGLVKAIHNKEFQIIKATTTEIQTNLTISNRGSSQLLGLGVGSSITGKHADRIFTDDIVNQKDRTSEAERKRTKMIYYELQNIKNRGGRIFNTGTPWHKDDCISIMPNVKRYSCYETGLISKEDLQALRDAMTDSLFAANYELKHIADANALFTSPKYTDQEKLLYNGVGHIDASYGGEDGTAFTIVKRHKEGYVMFGKRWNKHVSDCIPEIQVYLQRFRCGSISTEKNADKGFLAKDLRKKGIPTKEYHENMNKFVKISTYLKRDWKNIYWFDETDPDYINEILDYSEEAEHDDAPDSAASILRQINKGWIH